MIRFNATMRRLSDEEIDPMESEDGSMEPMDATHWAPWSSDTMQDVYNIITDKLLPPQKQVLEAHLAGFTYKDIGVSEKFWRYHWMQAIKRIKRELKV